MSESKAPDRQERAYREIEASLAATVVGRGFLADFAERARKADTRALLDAVAGLERRASDGAGDGDDGRLEAEVRALAEEVRQVRAELAGPEGGAADGPSRPDECAASPIQEATEEIQDTAWRMREAGFDPALCDLLDRRAREIHRSCAHHALAAEGLGRLLRAFTRIEQRLGRPAAAEAHAPEALATPAPGPEIGPAADVPPPGPVPDDAAARALARAELDRFAALDIRDRLRLST